MYSTIKIIKRISLVVLALSCITFSPTAQATCHEGCGGFNFNTFLGEDALLNNTGVDNTAIGANALLNNTGVDNTAVGALALRSNTTGGNTQDSSSNYPIVQLRSTVRRRSS